MKENLAKPFPPCMAELISKKKKLISPFSVSSFGLTRAAQENNVEWIIMVVSLASTLSFSLGTECPVFQLWLKCSLHGRTSYLLHHSVLLFKHSNCLCLILTVQYWRIKMNSIVHCCLKKLTGYLLQFTVE